MLFDIFEILICYDISVFWYLKGCFRYIILFFLLFYLLLYRKSTIRLKSFPRMLYSFFYFFVIY